MTGTQVTNYDEAWAKMAEQAVADEPQSGGQFLSMRGGVLKFQDNDLPGNQACVIVLDSLRENTYYTNKWDPDSDVVMPPKCYAFGRGDEEMAPHVSMQASDFFEPQSETCASCQWNVFGSADKGRGKACQNRRRLALLPAGFYSPKKNSRDFDLELFTAPEHYKTADIAYFKLPPTSVPLWTKYVTETATLRHRPFAGVLTRLYVEPHPKYQYQAHFEVLDLVPDELAATIMARSAEAQKAILQPYSPPAED